MVFTPKSVEWTAPGTPMSVTDDWKTGRTVQVCGNTSLVHAAVSNTVVTVHTDSEFYDGWQPSFEVILDAPPAAPPALSPVALLAWLSPDADDRSTNTLEVYANTPTTLHIPISNLNAKEHDYAFWELSSHPACTIGPIHSSFGGFLTASISFTFTLAPGVYVLCLRQNNIIVRHSELTATAALASPPNSPPPSPPIVPPPLLGGGCFDLAQSGIQSAGFVITYAPTSLESAVEACRINPVCASVIQTDLEVGGFEYSLHRSGQLSQAQYDSVAYVKRSSCTPPSAPPPQPSPNPSPPTPDSPKPSPPPPPGPTPPPIGNGCFETLFPFKSTDGPLLYAETQFASLADAAQKCLDDYSCKSVIHHTDSSVNVYTLHKSGFQQTLYGAMLYQKSTADVCTPPTPPPVPPQAPPPLFECEDRIGRENARLFATPKWCYQLLKSQYNCSKYYSVGSSLVTNICYDGEPSSLYCGTAVQITCVSPPPPSPQPPPPPPPPPPSTPPPACVNGTEFQIGAVKVQKTCAVPNPIQPTGTIDRCACPGDQVLHEMKCINTNACPSAEPSPPPLPSKPPPPPVQPLFSPPQNMVACTTEQELQNKR